MKILILIGVLLLSPIVLDKPIAHAEAGVRIEHVSLTEKIEKKLPKPLKELREVNVKQPKPTQTSKPTGNVEQIVRAAAIKHGLDPDWFVRLAMCESTMTPTAVNTSYYENGHPSGLFQHLSGYWPARAEAHGYAGASVFDPVANANVTAAMWATGSHLWECQ